jgi:hypothetical protein
MKKLIAILSILMIVSFTACNNTVKEEAVAKAKTDSIRVDSIKKDSIQKVLVLTQKADSIKKADSITKCTKKCTKKTKKVVKK